MQIKLARIGNSRGIRIPESVIEHCGLGDTVELTIEKGRLMVVPARVPREGWEEAFASAGSSTPDQLLPDLASGEFDNEEWTW